MKSASIIAAVTGVTKKWAKQRKAEERDKSARRNRGIMLRRRHVSIRNAAWQVVAHAYMRASANGTLPANARQIMYAARPHIQRLADRDLGSRFDQYFSQQLLPDYIEQTGVGWDVVYDDRGHFSEPHTGTTIGLGTLSVRNYLACIGNTDAADDEDDLQLQLSAFPTSGPQHRYGAILFIEKEGFLTLFEAVQLAERFDIAIMSTKGMSVTAARKLAEELCSRHGVPLLLLHDFDKSGFSIAATLQRDTRRYSFSRAFKVIDLGLRLDDVEGLETEDVTHNASDTAVIANLKQNGASEEEVEFLLERRVELNAMTSDALVAFIERKLTAAGIAKVIPDQPILAQAWRRVQVHARLNASLEELRDQIAEEVKTLPVPDDLAARVRAILSKHPELPWDVAVRRVVTGENDEESS